MKFGKKHSNMTVVLAMIHGVIIGIVAIAIVGFILAGAEGRSDIPKIKEDIPASGPASKSDENTPESVADSLQLYAVQHGVFTTGDAAATFIATDPSLAKTAIIQSGEKYFVWSAVGLTEDEIESQIQSETFRKSFQVNTSQCEENGGQQLREILTAKKIDEIKNLDTPKKEEEVSEFNQKLSAITAFTKDLSLIRLHLLSQYTYSEDCAKITF